MVWSFVSMQQCQLQKAHCRLDTNLQGYCLPRKVKVKCQATLSAAHTVVANSISAHETFGKRRTPTTATLTPHQDSSVSTGSCLWKHLFSNVGKRTPERFATGKIKSSPNSMSNFYRLLHKPVGTGVRERGQAWVNIGDCKPIESNSSYILYIYI